MMAWIKGYFDGFYMLSAPQLLLRSPSLAMREFCDDVIAHARIVREYKK